MTKVLLHLIIFMMVVMYNKYTKRHYVKNLTFFRYAGIDNNDLYIYWWPDYAEQ